VSLEGAGESPAFRLLLAGGGHAKLRVFSTSESAREVVRLLAAVKGSGLPRVRHVIGRAVVLEYVEGEVLDRHLARAGAAEETQLAAMAGRLLASIHAANSSSVARPRPLGDYGLLLRRVVRRLGRRGLLDATSVRRLTRIVVPRTARWTVTHGDLCPENLVLTPGGRLRAIDEERLAVRPYAFDLARTVARWPLDAAGEAALLSGYRSIAGEPRDYAADRHFWVGTALALTAAYRIHNGLVGVGRARDQLRALAKLC
jgi:Ser/Thr protein kinase RdoA (MazF antagonist)